MTKGLKLTLIIHAVYILVTSLWPLVDIVSFMVVTGYKTDIWLVKTVGALLLPISLTMLSFLCFKAEPFPLIILGASTALAFMGIDLVYALNDVISDVYLLDAAVECVFLLAWIYHLYYATNGRHPR
ncbi:hypothetical protein [Pseudochryseolinea flava]|uniref:Uncharacterized protein n=1 Tax=Pseudochryseolinea flava TaxID=2059302 RepID=A0A364Y2G9_9BACT|nr:hypothetical protein [Pseudochryseolinea flava]RAV99975.1 hypothetical protein DQQ10_15555 [Pseudochryseolinea flava]